MRIQLLLFLAFGFLLTGASAQEVSISPELNLRNYFAYHLLGDISGKSIVFRDRGYVKEVDVFNRELELVQSAELFLEKRRVDIFNVIEMDTVFQLLYGYFERDSMVFNSRRYNNRVELVDSVEFFRLHKQNIRKKIGNAESEDKMRTLLTTLDEDDNLVFMLYNSKAQKLEWSSKIIMPDQNATKFYDIILANNGDFLVPLSESVLIDKPDAISFILVRPSRGTHKFITIDMGDKSQTNITANYDNENDRWLICGTYADKKSNESRGYFFLSKTSAEMENRELFNYIPFEQRLYKELVQGRRKKNKVFEEIKLKNVVFRNDGGFLIISEVEREYARRNPYSNYARTTYDQYSRRAWIDYYNDDVIVSNISPDGTTLWNRVLYKKQFSQDDDGIYSSFFIMKTPSRLRFIYNDEIKRNNTVSEYLMDPAGKIARNSLLSTAYQKMKLRFRDAIQISANSLLIPSERNYDLNLVRITY